MTTAICPGTFDPITNGHLDVIRRASKFFDRFVVGVGARADKAPLFSLEERVQMVKDTTRDLPNVDVEPFDTLLVDFAKNVGATERATIKMKDLNRTFLGLSRDCLACHEDTHHGQLGKDCLKCHTLSGWKGPSGFDHSRTKFPLVGAHIRLACTKCHKPSETKAIKYVGLAFDRCASCHIDPHKAAFKSDCNSCHTTTRWNEIQSSEFASRFDHAKTKYPLLGKHSAVQCRTCHRGLNFTAPLAHGQCADCHRDPHQGQFRARKDGGACESCHTVDGFKKAKFGVAEHAATSYPLEG